MRPIVFVDAGGTGPPWEGFDDQGRKYIVFMDHGATCDLDVGTLRYPAVCRMAAGHSGEHLQCSVELAEQGVRVIEVPIRHHCG